MSKLYEEIQSINTEFSALNTSYLKSLKSSIKKLNLILMTKTF